MKLGYKVFMPAYFSWQQKAKIWFYAACTGVVCAVLLIVSLGCNLWNKLESARDAEQEAAESQRQEREEALWLQRVQKNEQEIETCQQRQSINPPDRDVVTSLFHAHAESVTLHRVYFEPEVLLETLGAYQVKAQHIKIGWQAHHDIAVVQWVTRMPQLFPGRLVLKKMTLTRLPPHQPFRLHGEVEWIWMFVRSSTASQLGE